MSGLVERLAKKWEANYDDTRPFEDDARFFVLAIAEELEARYKAGYCGDREARHNADAADWLREQSASPDPS